MQLPTLFIGSSKENIPVANLFYTALNDQCAKVTSWQHGIFGLNENYLEDLLKTLTKYEFAAFILAGDDNTISREKSMLSPRDNILFESGLFMGALGRTNTFLIYDNTIDLKLPSDLAGITLASYDNTLIKEGKTNEAIKEACDQIRNKIYEQEQKFPYLLGEWKSIYPLPFEENIPEVEEIVEISSFRDGISISSKENSQKDYYKATGRIVDHKIIGEWNSRVEDNDSSGIFMLIISPDGNSMYGYFTVPDERNSIMYAYWVLARMKETDEETITHRLKRAKELLNLSRIG